MTTRVSASVRPDDQPSGRVVRHKGIDRLYHWLMAVSVLTLMATGFLPIVGVKFDWVEPHWIAGVALSVLVLMHIVRATIWQDFWAMMIVPRDVKDGWAALGHAFGRRPAPPPQPGKYPLMQKLYHAAIAVTMLCLIVTGLMMMVRIDTPFWTRNPYWLPAATWGWVYVVHGLAALLSLTLVMIHIYFGLRPEKLWITRSMILGWITRGEYVAHHDPERWAAEPRRGERS